MSLLCDQSILGRGGGIADMNPRCMDYGCYLFIQKLGTLHDTIKLDSGYIKRIVVYASSEHVIEKA